MTRCDTVCEVAACEGACAGSCTTDVGCQAFCEVNCEAGCENICVTGCMPISDSVRFKQVIDRACDVGCEAAEETYPRIVLGFVRQPGGSTPVDAWLGAMLMHAELSIPVLGEITDGAVIVEFDKASFRPGTTVNATTTGGKQVAGATLSTAVIPFRIPIEVVVDVAEAGKKISVGGLLLLSEGSYRKGDGITIHKGMKATVLAKAKAYTGSLAQEVRIDASRFVVSAGPDRKGLSSIDTWSSAKISCKEIAVPLAGEIVEGSLLIELDKASFWPGTDVSAIIAGGKQVIGSTISTAAIALRLPIEASIAVGGPEKHSSVAGMLLSAQGLYKKGEGILIKKGTKATILTGAKTQIGNVAEDIRITMNMLETGAAKSGFRRLTR
jgi:hypothetical protein